MKSGCSPTPTASPFSFSRRVLPISLLIILIAAPVCFLTLSLSIPPQTFFTSVPNSFDTAKSSLHLRGPPISRPLNEKRAQEILENDSAFVIIHPISVLLTNHAQSASRQIYSFIYQGLFGKPYNQSYCLTPVQNVSGFCWNDNAHYLHHLPVQQQLHYLTSNETFRVAIQHHPYSRLLSAFSSTFSCDSQLLPPDQRVEHLVKGLRSLADIPARNEACMTIGEYAKCLDSLRRKILTNPTNSTVWNVHIRPMRFYFDEIRYHLVLNVSEASHREYISLLWQRLPFRHLLHTGIESSDAIALGKLAVPKEEERKIRLYASLSETREQPGNPLQRKGSSG